MEIVVIIPFRGELEELSEAVNSVRQSSMRSYRIIVIDDRPENVSRPAFLNEYEYLRSYGQGLPKAIEISKSHITEKYVALLAGDDLMSPDRLLLQYSEIQKSDSEICLSGMRKFSSKQSEIKMLIGKPHIETYSKMWLLLGAYGADGTILMTASFYKNKYKLDPIDSYSDWALALTDYPLDCAYVPKDLVFYRQHVNQTTRNKRNDFLQSSVYKAWIEVYKCFFNSTPPIESFLIISAPWFRTKITAKDILRSRFYIQQILEGFRSAKFTPSEIDSLESIVIKRYIYRSNIQNMPSVLYVLHKLKIKHVYIKLLIESIVIARAILLQNDIRPRLVRLDKK